MKNSPTHAVVDSDVGPDFGGGREGEAGSNWIQRGWVGPVWFGTVLTGVQPDGKGEGWNSRWGGGPFFDVQRTNVQRKNLERFLP